VPVADATAEGLTDCRGVIVSEACPEGDCVALDDIDS
jgi:hypothetical protein